MRYIKALYVIFFSVAFLPFLVTIIGLLADEDTDNNKIAYVIAAIFFILFIFFKLI